MSALSEATTHKPFSNGTEEAAWLDVWCGYCVHDHRISHNDTGGIGCPILLDYVVNIGSEWTWPEAWLPEPTGSHSLPSRMICGKFQPCTEDSCTGDALAETRSAITAEVTEFWQAQR